MANHPKLTPFGDLFEAATRTGLDEGVLAERLLKDLKAGLTAYGYRRQFTYPDREQVERLPRDTHRQPVPNYLWNLFDRVSDDLHSNWTDNPEDPEAWAEIDWVSGQIESFELEWQNFENVKTRFSNLGVIAKSAEAILSQLAGQPRKKPGRSKGPSDPWEMEQAQKGSQMIKQGDGRRDTVIAAELASLKPEGHDFDNRKRRILNGIRALLATTEITELE